jgi:hypothetical protein
MAHREFALLHQQNHRIGQAEQALDVGDMAAALVDHAGDVSLSHALMLGQALIGARLFDGVEVFALQVLDQRHHLALGQRADQRGNLMHLRTLRGAPAAFTRDKLKRPCPSGRTITG